MIKTAGSVMMCDHSPVEISPPLVIKNRPGAILLSSGLWLSACVLPDGGGLRVEPAQSSTHGLDESESDDGNVGQEQSDASAGTAAEASDAQDTAPEESDNGATDDSGNDSAGTSTTSTTASDTAEATAVTTEVGDTSESTTGEDPIVGSVEITVTTIPYGGRYSPRHVGAIWIEDAEGKFLNSVKVWAQRRQKHLPIWLEASGGDRLDAISGATINPHETHQVEWNRLDNEGVEHGRGQYVLRVEYAEHHANSSDPGPQLVFPFTIGDGAQDLTLPDDDNFADVLVRTPG